MHRLRNRLILVFVLNAFNRMAAQPEQARYQEERSK